MKRLNRQDFANKQYPTKIMQFGEGNFLRAFIDWQIDHLNKENGLNAGVSIVRPIDYDSLPSLDTQEGLYTSIVRGIDERGEAVENVRIIDCVNEEIFVYRNFERYMELAENVDLKIVFSNTTEAGIEYVVTDQLSDAPAKSFPAKLTQWLYKRFNHFSGSSDAGLMIIPCELIDYNGEKLKEIVLQYCQLWKLEQGFVDWLNRDNHFCSTLVDRIVTGFPHDEHAELEKKFGYHDKFMVTSEYFHQFVIQGPEKLNELLCPSGSNLNIHVVDDIYPYKQRKVAILNGAHTALVPLAYMSGIDSVGEAMEDPLFVAFIEKLMYDEIIPTLDLPQDTLEAFAQDVIKRFKNPFIHHLLMSISLNSMTKFQTRLMPQLHQYVAQNVRVPDMMCLALAAQILLYRGIRDGKKVELADSNEWMREFEQLWQQYTDNQITLEQLVANVLSAKWHWQSDLTQIPTLISKVTHMLEEFLQLGVRDVLGKFLEA